MSKTKLELQKKSDPKIVAFARAHQTAMTDNANFAAPVPSADDFEAIVAAAEWALADVQTKLTDWLTAVAAKDAAILALQTALIGRAGYVEAASMGDEAKILSAGLSVRAPRSASTTLPAPVNVAAAMGEKECEIKVTWKPVPGADTYVVQSSPQVLPRTWTQTAIVTRASFTATELTSGEHYAFRVAAVGPLGQGPWSDDASKMAP
jgi:hypothetical protein